MLGTMVLFDERLELAKEVLSLDVEAVEHLNQTVIKTRDVDVFESNEKNKPATPFRWQMEGSP